jgi:3-deoxy-D-manno-octulosonate 8-phosphate phosphatase (KDO 8-P phosphatase)
MKRPLSRIRLLALDVDGVLTDGRLWLGADGVERKLFSCIDGHGLVMLREGGVEVAFITREASGIALARADKLKVRCFEGVKAKGVVLRALREELGLSRGEVAYVGDDLPDLEAFAEAGLRIAVATARPEVRRAADWVTRAAGGNGAVREVCDRLLAARRGRRHQ